jgi:hypothetical protein
MLHSRISIDQLSVVHKLVVQPRASGFFLSGAQPRVFAERFNGGEINPGKVGLRELDGGFAVLGRCWMR